MIKRFVLIVSALVLWSAFCCAPAVMADPLLAGDYLRLIAYNSTDSAGIMVYDVSHNQGATVAFDYSTFCIQQNTTVGLNTWYKVQSLTSQVGPYDFAASPLPGEGPLNGAVDYLYFRYASGAYGSQIAGNQSNQADFQDMLWNLQGSAPTVFTVKSGTPWANDLAAYQARRTMIRQCIKTGTYKTSCTTRFPNLPPSSSSAQVLARLAWQRGVEGNSKLHLYIIPFM